LFVDNPKLVQIIILKEQVICQLEKRKGGYKQIKKAFNLSKIALNQDPKRHENLH
jgi:hypothetical protein